MEDSFVIKALEAIEIKDSRGNPTIEVNCILESGKRGRASVPSGASTGVHEAWELRDNNPAYASGRGVSLAIGNVNNEICSKVLGTKFNQSSLDSFLIKLDGTKNKSRLGANAILGVSLSFARAAAAERGEELYEYVKRISGTDKYNLPEPMCNIINGGKHSDSGLEIQEFMIVPVGIKSFEEKIKAVQNIFLNLKEILIQKGFETSLGDEGGFAPKLASNEEALDILMLAIAKTNFTTNEIKIALDVAASSFFDKGYKIKMNGSLQILGSGAMIEWYEKLILKYPIISIEDGLAEDDLVGFGSMMKKQGERIKIVGDDLLVTNIELMKVAAAQRLANATIIKANQIGTLTETISAANFAKSQNWSIILSHRSGETMDTWVADLAVGLGASFIKAGSPAKTERIVKYNRIMEIGKNLGNLV